MAENNPDFTNDQQAKKFCSQCGRQQESGTQFCASCGARVAEGDLVVQRKRLQEAATSSPAAPQPLQAVVVGPVGGQLAEQDSIQNLERRPLNNERPLKRLARRLYYSEAYGRFRLAVSVANVPLVFLYYYWYNHELRELNLESDEEWESMMRTTDILGQVKRLFVAIFIFQAVVLVIVAPPDLPLRTRIGNVVITVLVAVQQFLVEQMHHMGLDGVLRYIYCITLTFLLQEVTLLMRRKRAMKAAMEQRGQHGGAGGPMTFGAGAAGGGGCGGGGGG